MHNPIFFVTGNPWDKGKDLLSRLLIEHLLFAHSRPLLVEPYWEAPALSNAYAGVIDRLPIPLSDPNAMRAALDRLPGLLEDPSDRCVIINLPGRELHRIEHEIYGQMVDRIEPLGLEVWRTKNAPVAPPGLGRSHSSESAVTFVGIRTIYPF